MSNFKFSSSKPHKIETCEILCFLQLSQFYFSFLLKPGCRDPEDCKDNKDRKGEDGRGPPRDDDDRGDSGGNGGRGPPRDDDDRGGNGGGRGGSRGPGDEEGGRRGPGNQDGGPRMNGKSLKKNGKGFYKSGSQYVLLNNVNFLLGLFISMYLTKF